MKANKYKGNARKGSRVETKTILINKGIATDANQKVTKVITRDRYFKDKGKQTLAGFFYSNYDIGPNGKIYLRKED